MQNLDDETGTIELKIGERSADSLPTSLVEGGPSRQTSSPPGCASSATVSSPLISQERTRRPPSCRGSDRAAETLKGHHFVVPARSRWTQPRGSASVGQLLIRRSRVFPEREDLRRRPPDPAAHREQASCWHHGPLPRRHLQLHRRGREAGRASLAVPPDQAAAGPGHPLLHPAGQPITDGALSQGLADEEFDIAAGTVWMWARDPLREGSTPSSSTKRGRLLANVLAIAGVARNVVLLGDPQQLAQPSQAAHPPGAGAAARARPRERRRCLRTLGCCSTAPGACTRRSARTRLRHSTTAGSSQSRDWRTRRSSETPRPAGWGSGRAGHAGGAPGNSNSSVEEAAAVAEPHRHAAGPRVAGNDRRRSQLTPDDILVVTPYNAQVRAIEEAFHRTEVGAASEWHRGQVPGPAGSGGGLLHGDFFVRGGAPRHGVPLRPPPAERRHVAGQGDGDHRRQPGPCPRVLLLPPAMVLANALCRAWERE